MLVAVEPMIWSCTSTVKTIAIGGAFVLNSARAGKSVLSTVMLCPNTWPLAGVTHVLN